MVTITNPAALHFSSGYRNDQIIGIFSKTVTLAAPAAFSQTIDTSTFAHNFGDNCYFQGIFTMDGGTTWNDFGAQTPNLTAPNPQFQTVDVIGMTDSTNLTVYATNYYDTAHSSSTSRTVTYKVYLLAKNIMAVSLTPLATNQILAYSTDYNFQKVAQMGSTTFSVSSGSTATVTISHSLNTIPKVRAFFSPTGSGQMWSTTQFKTPPTTSPIIQTQLTTSTVTFYSDQQGGSGVTFSGTIDYRIYFD